MAHALALGRRGLGRTWPNPAVGCVIVSRNRVVGRGWTAPGGRPHAEPQALAQAGVLARGATAYVTLEPCSHVGQTPPCAQALIEAGVARVVVAVIDRDPRVSGRGVAMLQQAGIAVDVGVLEHDARRDHAGFFLKTDAQRPYVSLKLALSLDGRIATASGESQWITGPHARRVVHGLRASHDAVLVGGGTARADNPSLTVRDMGAVQQPVRIVMSRSLDMPVDGVLAQTARQTPVWLCHGPDAAPARQDIWTALGAKLIPCDLEAGRLSARSVLEQLAQAGLTRVFCEGGGQVAASLLAADLVDALHVFSAGMALGAEGTPAIGALGVERLAMAPRLTLRDARRVGADLHHIWEREE